jgi:hypothetical protein
MDKVEFLGKSYDVAFDMQAFEDIANALGVDNIEQMGEKLMSGNIIALLKSSRSIAFYGIDCGCRKNKTENSFKSADELGDVVTKFSDLSPFSEVFTKSWLGFFSVDAPKEKKDKG